MYSSLLVNFIINGYNNKTITNKIGNKLSKIAPGMSKKIFKGSGINTTGVRNTFIVFDFCV